MQLATLIVAVLALIAAVGGVVTGIIQGRRSGEIQEQQAAALERLVTVEEHRALRENAAEEAAVQDEEERRRRALLANLTVRIAAVAHNESARVVVHNDGPHAATITAGRAWNGEQERPFATTTWKSPWLPLTLEPGEQELLPLGIVGAGPASVELMWEDGAGEHDGSFPIDVPPAAPALPPIEFLRGRR